MLPTYKTKNWPAYSGPFRRHWFEQIANAHKREGSLTTFFDLEMSREVAPTGKRGHQYTYSDTAMLACLTMKLLFGMALRQTTRVVESLLRRLAWIRRYATSAPWAVVRRPSP